jgi:hypothetical protein
MALDPISALSVAAAAVQFVQLSSQLVSKGRHVYNSSHGTTEENEIAESVTLRLQELTKRVAKASVTAPTNTCVSNSMQMMPSTQASLEMSEHHERIRSICEECETADQRQIYEDSRSAFVQADAENRKISVQFHILQNLRFAEMSYRASALHPAHSESFKWLF